MRNALNFFHHKGDVLTVRLSLTVSKQHEGNEGKPKEISFVYLVSFVLKIFSPENIWAFMLFLIVVALIIFTTDPSPVWIYQGF